jgi:hypothetical protein
VRSQQPAALSFGLYWFGMTHVLHDAKIKVFHLIKNSLSYKNLMIASNIDLIKHLKLKHI